MRARAYRRRPPRLSPCWWPWPEGSGRPPAVGAGPGGRPGDDHRRRQHRRRHRAARAAHQPRHRHRHLHPGRARQPGQTGWGLAGETWTAMDGSWRRWAGEAWFRLGDRDLATHLYRTQRLREGATPERGDRRAGRRPGGSPSALLSRCPTTRCGTRVDRWPAAGSNGGDHRARWPSRTTSSGSATPCRCGPSASTGAERGPAGPRRPRRDRRRRAGRGLPVQPAGLDRSAPGRPRSPRRPGRPARPTWWPCPRSWPARRSKGPADRLLTELGHESSVVGVARLYAPWVGTLVIDEADAALAGPVEAEGVRCVVAPTVMSEPRAGRRAGRGGARCRCLSEGRRPVDLSR